jgi:hypothetical protein
VRVRGYCAVAPARSAGWVGRATRYCEGGGAAGLSTVGAYGLQKMTL